MAYFRLINTSTGIENRYDVHISDGKRLYMDSYENYLQDGGVDILNKEVNGYTIDNMEYDVQTLEINNIKITDFTSVGDVIEYCSNAIDNLSGIESIYNNKLIRLEKPIAKLEELNRGVDLRVDIDKNGDATIQTEKLFYQDTYENFLFDTLTDVPSWFREIVNYHRYNDTVDFVNGRNKSVGASTIEYCEALLYMLPQIMLNKRNRLGIVDDTVEKADKEHTHLVEDIKDFDIKSHIDTLESDVAGLKDKDTNFDAQVKEIEDNFAEKVNALESVVNENNSTLADGKAEKVHTHVKADITDFEHTHDYETLENLPTIPSIEGLAKETYVDEKVSDAKWEATEYTDSSIQALKGGVDTNLNSLYKIANAIGNDKDFSQTLDTRIQGIDDRLEFVEEDAVRNESFENLTDKVEDIQDQIDTINTPVYRPSLDKFAMKDLRWIEQDPLVIMKDKYNTAIMVFEDKFNSFNDFNNKLSNVDNTADIDKPVSNPQKEYINNFINISVDLTEEADEAEFDILNGVEGYPTYPESEISPPIKDFIREEILNVGNRIGMLPPDIATDKRAGIIKSGGDIAVDAKGNVTLPTITSAITDLQGSINDLNDKASTIGQLEDLKTTERKSLVDAINEVFQLGSKNKEMLVECLASKGINCSTDDNWEELITKVTEIATGDLYDATLVARHILEGEIGYGPFGKVYGTMPNRYVNGEIISDEEKDLRMVTTTATYDTFGSVSQGNDRKGILINVPKGYYDENTSLFISAGVLASIIGLTKEDLAIGVTVLEVTGA